MAAENNNRSTHPANTAEALQARFRALDPVSLLSSRRSGKEGGTEQRCPAAQISSSTVTKSNDPSPHPATTAPALLEPISLLRSRRSRKEGGTEQRCPAGQISPSTVTESNDPSPHPATTAPVLLDPVYLLLSQNSATDDIVPLRLTTDHYFLERGPRYNAYARLRESRLRMKHARQEEPEPEDMDLSLIPPPKKQVRFQGNLGGGSGGGGGGGRRGSPSILAQSVPDFSLVLRKENRKPAALPSLAETTPPSKSWSKAAGARSNARGSKSMARKSYATVEELKRLSCATASAINGDDRGRIGRGNGIGRNILGYRKF